MEWESIKEKLQRIFYYFPPNMKLNKVLQKPLVFFSIGRGAFVGATVGMIVGVGINVGVAVGNCVGVGVQVGNGVGFAVGVASFSGVGWMFTSAAD